MGWLSEEESSRAVDRRRVFRQLLPYVASAYSNYRSVSGALAPERFVLQALKAPQNALPKRMLKGVSEEDLLAEIRGMTMKVVALGVISLQLTQDQVFGFIEDELRREFATEGARGARFVRTAPTRASLMLPSRTVEVEFLPVLTQADEASLVEEASTDLSETWVFTSSAHAETDTPLEPLFISEQKVQLNHFRIVPLTKLLAGVFGKHWDVVATGQNGAETIVVLNQKVEESPLLASGPPNP